ncbi:MAG TPA: TM2 domain-containing protein [Allosphingosinicella sp.]|jgi:TM2 domain-containing membrane protein YozV
MRGQVLGVDRKTGDGVVAGDDGLRYTFRPNDWSGLGEPAVGMQVDFENQQTRALSIFPVPGTAGAQVATHQPAASYNDRNKILAAVLAFFLGPLGIHRFYLGRTGSGIVMLVLSCTIVGLLISAPWAFIDMIRYLIMSDRDFAERYARKN